MLINSTMRKIMDKLLLQIMLMVMHEFMTSSSYMMQRPIYYLSYGFILLGDPFMDENKVFHVWKISYKKKTNA